MIVRPSVSFFPFPFICDEYNIYYSLRFEIVVIVTTILESTFFLRYRIHLFSKGIFT
jgi:hypothetical protein